MAASFAMGQGSLSRQRQMDLGQHCFPRRIKVMRCHDCGKDVSSGILFCPKCGNQLDSEISGEWFNKNGTSQDPAALGDHLAGAPQYPVIVDHEDYELEIEPSDPRMMAPPPAPIQAEAEHSDPSEELISMLRGEPGSRSQHPAQRNTPPSAPSSDEPTRNISFKGAPDQEAYLQEFDVVSERFDQSSQGLVNAYNDVINEHDIAPASQPSAFDEAFDPEESFAHMHSFEDEGFLEEEFFSSKDINFENDGFDDDDFDADFNNEEDSGPVPVASSEYEPSRSRKPKKKRRVKRRQGEGLWLTKLRSQADDLTNRIPAKYRPVLLVLFVVFGLTYVFSGGDDSTSEETQGEVSVNAPAAPAASPSDEEPLFELIDMTPQDAALEATPKPVEASPNVVRNHPLYPKSALSHTTRPLSTKAKRLSRVCVLRAGPSSRFSSVISSIPQGAKVTLLARGTKAWTTSMKGKQSSWIPKDCKGSACVHRQGPGEIFKILRDGDKTVKPRKSVTSSGNWRYVKYKGKYGWTGPACWR